MGTCVIKLPGENRKMARERAEGQDPFPNPSWAAGFRRKVAETVSKLLEMFGENNFHGLCFIVPFHYVRLR